VDAVTRAAELIEPHIDGKRRRADRAHDAAQDLADAGLLAGGQTQTASRSPVRDQAAAVLQCRLSWGPAEAIAAELESAGLLRADTAD
jgi:hypothetical protein